MHYIAVPKVMQQHGSKWCMRRKYNRVSRNKAEDCAYNVAQ